MSRPGSGRLVRWVVPRLCFVAKHLHMVPSLDEEGKPWLVAAAGVVRTVAKKLNQQRDSGESTFDGAIPPKKGCRAAQVTQRWGFSVQFHIETTP